MKISNAELKVIRFSSEDVIATSSLLGPLSGTSGFFYIPSSQFSGSYDGTGNYVEFSGTFGSYDGSNYKITNISGAKAGVDEDQNNLASVTSGKAYFSDVGVWVPASPVLENISKHAYDAYSYNGGYYTNGVSYYESHWQ